MRVHCRVVARKSNGWWVLRQPYSHSIIELPGFLLPNDVRSGDEVTLSRTSDAAAWSVVRVIRTLRSKAGRRHLRD